MEWISVKDKLPIPERGSIYSQGVLAVNIEDSCIFVATYVSHANSWHDYYEAPQFISYPYGKSEVTHWMPLPEPPKEEK